jgi:hypothetical protein
MRAVSGALAAIQPRAGRLASTVQVKARLVAVKEAGMTTRTTMVLEDDLEGGPAEETLHFSLGAADYEIDVNAQNAALFRQHLAPFAARAHKVGRESRGRAARSSSARQRSGVIREWARAQGITVGDRGRIPASVIERYEAVTTAR